MKALLVLASLFVCTSSMAYTTYYSDGSTATTYSNGSSSQTYFSDGSYAYTY
jgi:hypothetical protein